jgi:asparagine synthase (glutamine-hydrolysing)
MCGIAGFVQTHPFIREDAVPLLWEALALRGPNDQGYLSLDNNQFICQRHWNPAHAVSPLLLVHRRLSILDLSPSGWQPMCSPDGNYALVFNGEIYNYRELRALLEQEGFTFKSQSDTEVLLYALMAWGADALKKCIGMFALAFVNKSARTLLLARDFFGIKPLYYGTKTGVLAFCSTISGVLSSLKMPAVAHRSKALEYLTYGGTDEGSQTLFAGVHQLPPAHYAKISLDAPEKLEITRYWRAEVQQTIDCSFDEAKAEVRRIFLESIGLHLRSDVPLGTALSGGLDSSSIVMGMRAHLGPSAQLHAFSYIADEERIKEERWVDLLAKQAQITPDKIFATESDLANQIALLARSIEEPCTSASVFAQRLVFERAKMRGITVMLDGQGADEIFGGYDHYLAIQL